MVQKKESREFIALQNWNLMGARGFFGWQRNGRPSAGLEEMLHVYRNYHPDHSRYRVARGLQRHRRRTVLRHRLLWRRRPWPHRCHPADSTTARKALVPEIINQYCSPSFETATSRPPQDEV